MENRFLFLGTGGSMGVPVVTCQCPVCTSSSQLNKRLRPAGLLQVNGKTFLIDAGPDLREQMLHYDIGHLDGVLLTHAHYDHVGGIDELRIFYFLKKEQLPILSSEETYEIIRHRFHYLFETPPDSPIRSPQFQFELLKKDFMTFEFEGVTFETVTYMQAGVKVTGYRCGTFAYISDIRHFDEQVVDRLQGVETLILSALRYRPSEVHFSIDEAVAFSQRVGAARTYFTHIAHELEHDETNAKLPKGIRLGHDGLEIPLQ